MHPMFKKRKAPTTSSAVPKKPKQKMSIANIFARRKGPSSSSGNADKSKPSNDAAGNDVVEIETENAAPTETNNAGPTEPKQKRSRKRIGDDSDDDDGDDNDDNNAPAGATTPSSAAAAKSKTASSPEKKSSTAVVVPAEDAPAPKKKATWGFFSLTAKSGAEAGKPEAKVSIAGAWPRGSPVPYEAVANLFGKLEATTKRLEIVKMVSDFFRLVITLTPEDLLPVVYLASNSIAPQFENVELGIGDMVIKKALQEATGRSLKHINAALKETGDLGEVAEGSKKSIRTLYKPPPLTVRHVFKKFKEISTIAGAKSGVKKGNIVKSLLAAGASNLRCCPAAATATTDTTDTTDTTSSTHLRCACPRNSIAKTAVALRQVPVRKGDTLSAPFKEKCVSTWYVCRSNDAIPCSCSYALHILLPMPWFLEHR